MVQRLMYTVTILCAFAFLTAMGSSGGFERAPRVEKNFAVVITDAAGNKIEGQRFSWEGRIQFSGYYGLAQMNMPFDKVRELSVGEQKDRAVVVNVTLVDGTKAKFEIDAKSRCFGEANFGSFMLTMNEIKSVTFK